MSVIDKLLEKEEDSEKSAAESNFEMLAAAARPVVPHHSANGDSHVWFNLFCADPTRWINSACARKEELSQEAMGSESTSSGGNGWASTHAHSLACLFSSDQRYLWAGAAEFGDAT